METKKPKCLCGCGKRVRLAESKFILGHNMRVKKYNHRQGTIGFWRGKKRPEHFAKVKGIKIPSNSILTRKRNLESNPMKDPEIAERQTIQHKNFFKTEEGAKVMEGVFKNLKIFYKTPEGLKLKAEMVKRRALQVLPVKDTKIEVKIQEFLKFLKVDFFTHQYMRGIEHPYQCDILIPSMNMVIECDGDYWHNYPIGNEKDHIRTKDLIDRGFKVLRLWGSEINAMDVDEFSERLVIANNG